jgi:hypothetical protein
MSASPLKADIASLSRHVRLGHKRTHAPQQTAWLFNHLVGQRKQLVGDFERGITRPAGTTFSASTSIAIAAIHSTFTTPPMNSNAISAQQQPMQ